MQLLGAMSEEMLEEDANARKIVIPQWAPQSVEVPPNVEAKHIVSGVSPLLSYSSNYPFLN